MSFLLSQAHRLTRLQTTPLRFETRREIQRDPPKKAKISPALSAELEAVFKVDPYAGRETRTMLAEKIGCSMKQISNW